jgi:hypothetical protein
MPSTLPPPLPNINFAGHSQPATWIDDDHTATTTAQDTTEPRYVRRLCNAVKPPVTAALRGATTLRPHRPDNPDRQPSPEGSETIITLNRKLH